RKRRLHEDAPWSRSPGPGSSRRRARRRGRDRGVACVPRRGEMALEKVAAAYNASHPSTKVTTLAVPYDAFADKISAAVPRGKGPDVFIYAQDRLGGWIEAGNTVEPIDFFLDPETKARFIPTTMEAMTYKGTVYGLPLNYKCITLIYNKKLVR